MARWPSIVVAGLIASTTLGCASDEGGRRNGDSPETEISEEQQVVLDAGLAEVRRLEAERAGPEELAPWLAVDQPESVRHSAVRALARLEHTSATDLLVQALGDPNANIRADAAFGLGQLDVAMQAGLAAHDRLRSGTEQLMIFYLDKEPDPRVRRATLRALGRLSAGSGLAKLKEIADGESSERADALYALGVSGSRRGASLKNDPDTLRIAGQALASPDVGVRRAAAYLIFRQKMPLPERGAVLLQKPDDAQTTIHLLRALALGAGPALLAEASLKHSDWRVRTESVRALSTVNPVPTAPLLQALEVAIANLTSAQGNEAGANAHVVRLACHSLINAPMDVTRPAFVHAAQRLKEVRPDAACACAVAHDAQQARLDQIKTCAPGWPEDRRRRLGVAVAASSLISTKERAGWLKTALDDDSDRVRLDAANALANENTAAAAQVAAAAVVTERDAAVAGALLRALSGEHERFLKTRVLAEVVDRFLSATTIEEAEPLLEAGRLIQSRKGRLADLVVERLSSHVVLHVRLKVTSTAFGDRPHGPIARVTLPPDPATLPEEAILNTERGPIRIRFERDQAPGTVANFLRLAEEGVLTGTPFHRVVADFVAQGGDPRGTGSGGPGYTIACENHDGSYSRGAIGMALAGKDTGGSQFFLTQSEQPHLDGRYTLFARVVSGEDVMDALGPDDVLTGVDIPK